MYINNLVSHRKINFYFIYLCHCDGKLDIEGNLAYTCTTINYYYR